LVSAALVAVMVQVPAPTAVSVAPLMVQLALFEAYVTAPVPEPPVVLSVVVPPKATVDGVLTATSVACVAWLTVTVIPAEVAAA
jgi:hypothetical protein